MWFDQKSHSVEYSGSVFRDTGEAFCKTFCLLVGVKHVQPTPEDTYSTFTEPMSTCVYLWRIALWGFIPRHALLNTLCSQIPSRSFPSYAVYCKRLTSAHLITRASLLSCFWIDLANRRHWQGTGEQRGEKSRCFLPPPLLQAMAEKEYVAIKSCNNDLLKSLLHWLPPLVCCEFLFRCLCKALCLPSVTLRKLAFY